MSSLRSLTTSPCFEISARRSDSDPATLRRSKSAVNFKRQVVAPSILRKFTGRPRLWCSVVLHKRRKFQIPTGDVSRRLPRCDARRERGGDRGRNRIGSQCSQTRTRQQVPESQPSDVDRLRSVQEGLPVSAPRSPDIFLHG